MDLDEFLVKNRVDREVWEKSGLSWTVLCDIAKDHDGQLEKLRDTADIFAKTIQRFSGVHSVRWRIKDVDHLLEKIIRKSADGIDKYKNINCENYFKIVTDLVGVRALHLFKSDCFVIDDHLKRTWDFIEKPTAYVRSGDPDSLNEQFEEKGFEVKSHPFGYRSIHYICSTKPLKRDVIVEIQVRTIFEEGWSEIDHRIRYPNFSDNKLVAYFLTIFNRLAGSADEMGSFVQELTEELYDLSRRIDAESKEKEDVLAEMNKLLNELEVARSNDGTAKDKISKLQNEVSKLKDIALGSKAPTVGKKFHNKSLDALWFGDINDAYSVELNNERKKINKVIVKIPKNSSEN